MAINGNEYGWIDIRITMLGRPVAGVIGIEYKEKRDKKNVYGVGTKPIARVRGAKTYEGKISLLQSELQAIQLSIGSLKDPTDIGMFDITISYIPDNLTGIIITDTLKDCEFLEVPKGSKAGDMNMEIEMPIIIGDIDFGV
jgi:hypothetical protein